jgi:hypothetical protein
MRFDSHKKWMRSKEFNCFSRFVFPAKAVCRAQAAARFNVPIRLARKINDGLDERECGRQQHERQCVGSEAGVMAAWMLICSCIFCIGHNVEIVSSAVEEFFQGA